MKIIRKSYTIQLPDEMIKELKKIVNDENIELKNEIAELKKEIECLKIDIEILREGGNI